jgi:hypothetical protein
VSREPIGLGVRRLVMQARPEPSHADERLNGFLEGQTGTADIDGCPSLARRRSGPPNLALDDGVAAQMDLRPELMPPALDEEKVARLAKLADRIDGAAPGLWEDDLAEFNRLAGTEMTFEDFQGIYKVQVSQV